MTISSPPRLSADPGFDISGWVCNAFGVNVLI